MVQHKGCVLPESIDSQDWFQLPMTLNKSELKKKEMNQWKNNSIFRGLKEGFSIDASGFVCFLNVSP